MAPLRPPTPIFAWFPLDPWPLCLYISMQREGVLHCNSVEIRISRQRAVEYSTASVALSSQTFQTRLGTTVLQSLTPGPWDLCGNAQMCLLKLGRLALFLLPKQFSQLSEKVPGYHPDDWDRSEFISPGGYTTLPHLRPSEGPLERFRDSSSLRGH